MSNASSLISSLKEYNKNSSLPIPIPTLDIEAQFKVLTIKEHKNIINTISQSEVPGEIANIFNNVIYNSCDTEIAPKLTTLDRPIILMSIRSHLFGDDMTVEGKEINLLDHITKSLKEPVTKNILSKLIKDDNFEIRCKVPTIKSDISINNVLFNDVKVDNDTVLGRVFLYELIKFIDTITFNDVVYTFNDISIKNRIEICELLPITISNEITTYINTVKDRESQYLKVSDDITLVAENILFSETS